MASISVIIPVYNAAAVIGRCMDSLRQQSFQDWEAICIDDGSTDGSADMLDALSAGDPRIRVIHQANAGVSAARNTALGLAGGQYLMFVDSDDFLHPQAMEICIAATRRDGSDIVAFTYDRSYRTRLTIRHYLGLKEPSRIAYRHFGDVPFKVTDDIFAWATEYSKPKDIDRRWAVKHCQPWRCLYRAETVKDISFIEGIIYEDFPWWSEVLLRVRRATILNLPLYFYYPNFGGYIHSAKQKQRIRSLKTALEEAGRTYESKATAAQRARWEQQFKAPFTAKLQSKIRKYGDA